MKKSIFTIVTVLSMGTFFGQGLSLGFKTGFNFPMSGQEMGSEREYSNTGGPNTLTSEKVIYGTNGQGIPLTLDARYMFNENVGVQLDLTYLIGINKTVDHSTTTYLGGYTSETTQKLATHQFRILPQLVIKNKGLYARAGVVLPLFGSTKLSAVNKNDIPLQVHETVQEVKLTGKLSIGFVGAIGYQFDLSDKLGIFGEVEYLGLSIKRKQAEYTKYTADGVDQLPILKPEKTVYEDKLDGSSASNVALGQKGLYSSLGIQIGVRFNF